jgi:hypothetical protein
MPTGPSTHTFIDLNHLSHDTSDSRSNSMDSAREDTPLEQQQKIIDIADAKLKSYGSWWSRPILKEDDPVVKRETWGFYLYSAAVSV